MSSSGLFGPGVESIWQQGKRRRKSAVGVQGVTAQHVSQLGEAEQLYVNADYHEVVRMLSGLIKDHPKWSDPYSLLALTYEALGQKHIALQLFILSASLQNKRRQTFESWKKVAFYAYEVQYYEQSYNAVLRCLKFDPPSSSSSSASWCA